jgi:predicted CXXCH cytochrome family protein
VRPSATLLLLAGLLFLSACEPVFSRQALSRVFNGVPTIPPREEACRAFYEEQARQKEKQGAAAQAAEAGPGSKHRPYAEKHCGSCHATEGGVSEALLKPKQELCLSCHQKIMKGAYFHGPAAEGDCLSCHDPHESVNSSLLKKARGVICGQCHVEKRVAFGMHEQLAAHKVACPDCHDPHAGETRYFLK